MNSNISLILASKSPRRRQLLEQAGIPFRLEAVDVEEDYPDDLDDREVASYLALKKAKAFREISGDEVVVTADTMVLIDGHILGKPSDRNEAIEMLKKLSGTVNEVITGVSLKHQGGIVSFQEVTRVFFNPISDEEIIHYVDKYKPFDKAGAYAIQEWIGIVAVSKIEGSYFNVMGLPVSRLILELKKLFPNP